MAAVIAGMALHPARALEAEFDGAAGPAGPIVIALSEPADGETLARLAVELDGSDVTALLTVDGSSIAVTPVAPLGPGAHSLILYYLGPSDFEIVGEWTFTVAGTAADAADAPGFRFEADGTHNASFIGHQDGVTVSADSAGSARIEFLDGQGTASANYLLATEPEARLTDNVIDLGEYSFEIRHSDEDLAALFRLGHQAVDYDDVLVSDLSRRGAGIQLGTADQRFVADVFGLNPQSQLVGVDNFSGLDTREDRMFGGALTLRPFEGIDLKFVASGYHGRGSEGDGSIVGEGSGGALSAQAAFLDGRLRLSAGGALTRFDADGDGALVGAESGYAVITGISYDILTGINEDGTAAPSLTVGAGYERIDEDYFSYAFPGLATGRESTFADAYYAFEALSLQLRALHQTDNVNGIPSIATNRLVDLNASAFYTPFAEGGGPEWLGLPSLDASIQFQTQDEIEAAMPAFPAEDYTAINLGLGFTSSHESWGWNARYGYSDHDAKLDPTLDYTSHSVTLGVNLTPAGGYAFDISGTASFVDPGTGPNRTDFDMATTLTAPLIDETLDLSTTYIANFSTKGEGLEGGDLSGELAWSVFDGVQLVALGGLTHGDSVFPGDGINWYGGLVLRISTPHTYPEAAQ